MRKGLTAVVSTALVAGMIAAVPPARAAQEFEVEVGHIRNHLQALQRIARANANDREAGRNGDKQSRAYAIDVFKKAGYSVTEQTYKFPYYRKLAPSIFEVTSPNPIQFTEWPDENPDNSPEDFDFRYLEFSAVTQNLPGGAIEGNLQAVKGINVDTPTNPVSSGCTMADFSDFVPGNVALIQRGTCSFFQKVDNAIDAGASGVVLFNRGVGVPGQPGAQTGAFDGTLGDPRTKPAIFASFRVGKLLTQLLAQGGPVRVKIGITAVNEIRASANVIAERKGATDRVFLYGGKLDTSFGSPGINNNGSGAGTLLAIAEELNKRKIKTYNTVRFGLWGSSFSALAGARTYLGALIKNPSPPVDKKKIVGYLNVDSLGSKNGVPFVYESAPPYPGTPVNPKDPDSTEFSPLAGPPGADGSDIIEDVLHASFTQHGIQTAPRRLESLSDYEAFVFDTDLDDNPIDRIPFGAVTSGFGVHKRLLADKTAEEAAAFGGKAGEAYDPCSSQACDTLSNISNKMLEQMAEGTATAVLTLANNRTLPTR